VLEAGLRCVAGQGAWFNSISLKEGEEPFLRQARTTREYGAGVVVMAFDEQGQARPPPSASSDLRPRLRTCSAAGGFPAEDIIFDRTCWAVATGNQRAQRLRQGVPGRAAADQAALSRRPHRGRHLQPSFSFRGNDVVREAMHSAFLSTR